MAPSFRGARILKKKITAKHSFPGIKNQVTVNSKITLKVVKDGNRRVIL